MSPHDEMTIVYVNAVVIQVKSVSEISTFFLSPCDSYDRARKQALTYAHSWAACAEMDRVGMEVFEEDDHIECRNLSDSTEDRLHVSTHEVKVPDNPEPKKKRKK